MIDFEGIGTPFVTFYTNLFSSASPIFDYEVQELITPLVNNAHNEALNAILEPTEIHKALLSVANNKSSSPNGMSPIFYKFYWNIVGRDIISAVQGFFSNPTLNRAANHTFYCLVQCNL